MVAELANMTTLCSPVIDNSAHQILTRQIVPVVFTLIVIIGLVGNALVIVVVLANIQMRNTTNLLIISLAMADLAFIVFCVPFTAVYYVVGNWILGEPLCKLYMYTTYLTAYLSVYTLVLMSFDRYLAVVHPIESRTWRTEKNTIIAVSAVWVFFMLMHVPLLIDTDVVASVDVNSSCHYALCAMTSLTYQNKTTLQAEDNRKFSQIYFSTFFFFGYILPFIAICVLYGCLIRRLLCGRTAKMAQSEEAARGKRRVTLMVVIVIAVFGVCWLPIQVIFIIQFFAQDPMNVIFRVVHVVAQCLVYANSSINPILYAFLSENFRKAFAKALCCCRSMNAQRTLDFERTHVTHLNRSHPMKQLASTSAHSPDAVATTGALEDLQPLKDQHENNSHKCPDRGLKVAISFENDDAVELEVWSSQERGPVTVHAPPQCPANNSHTSPTYPPPPLYPKETVMRSEI